MVFGAWTLYSALTVAYFYFFNEATSEQIVPMLVRWILQGWTWTLLVFPILAASRRWPFRRGRLTRAIAIHLAMFLAAQLVLGLVDRVVAYGFYRVTDRPLFYLFATARLNSIFYAVLVAGEHAYRHGRISAVHALEAAELRRQLVEAQLEALRSQLQPHFLFNALHDISELVYQDPARAEQALARLGDLLRTSLALTGRQEITLRDELTALDAYLEVQRLRFPETFDVRVNATAHVAGAAVPSFVLQPLVENAIRHGASPEGHVHVEVDARVTGDSLVLRVIDQGAGLATAAPREGTGLRVTRARLAQLYGSRAACTLENANGRGAAVTIRIPHRTLTASEGGS